jgi:hypothetical protein
MKRKRKGRGEVRWKGERLTIILSSSFGSGDLGVLLSSCNLELNFPALGLDALTPFLFAYLSASSHYRSPILSFSQCAILQVPTGNR